MMNAGIQRMYEMVARIPRGIETKEGPPDLETQIARAGAQGRLACYQVSDWNLPIAPDAPTSSTGVVDETVSVPLCAELAAQLSQGTSISRTATVAGPGLGSTGNQPRTRTRRLRVP